jgi:hypothetical protein
VSTERVNVPVEPELRDAIEGWRRKQPRIPSRADAMRTLMWAGIKMLQSGSPSDDGEDDKSIQ